MRTGRSPAAALGRLESSLVGGTAALLVLHTLLDGAFAPERGTAAADHLAATAFGEYQPFGPGDTPEAYAKDRRIELRLTDR